MFIRQHTGNMKDSFAKAIGGGSMLSAQERQTAQNTVSAQAQQNIGQTQAMLNRNALGQGGVARGALQEAVTNQAKTSAELSVKAQAEANAQLDKEEERRRQLALAEGDKLRAIRQAQGRAAMNASQMVAQAGMNIAKTVVAKIPL